MIKNTYFATLIVVILLSNIFPAHSDQSDYQKLIERIDNLDQLINQASSTSSLWRETKNLSDSAKKYAQAENYTLANETLTEAEYQAKLGIQQALEQADINKLIPSYLQH